MFRKTVIAIGVGSIVSLQAWGGAWSYSGEQGPEHWAELSAEYEACGKGRNQSPVDLRGALDTDLEPVEFHYESGMKDIVNNGHTVQINMSPGSFIKLDGEQYTLKQFHFHAPSENRIEGRSFPLEGHFVHVNRDGDLAVVAVMFTEDGDGGPLRSLWQQLPARSGDQKDLSSLKLPDASSILPADRSYYRFNGSLTTPPCSEGVLWLVMKEPVAVSAEQAAAFRQAIGGHANNRPVQPLNARAILK